MGELGGGRKTQKIEKYKGGGKAERLPDKETIDKIEKVYSKYQPEIIQIKDIEKRVEFIDKKIILEIGEIKPDSLQKVLNGLIEYQRTRGVESYGIDKEAKKYYFRDFGLLISRLNNNAVGKYVKEELRKGKKLGEIESLKTRIDAGSIIPINFLAYEHPVKSNLTIENAGNNLCWGMRGGEVAIKGEKIGSGIGRNMTGGEIHIYSDENRKQLEKKFDPSAFSNRNKGRIVLMTAGEKIEQLWPKEKK